MRSSAALFSFISKFPLRSPTVNRCLTRTRCRRIHTPTAEAEDADPDSFGSYTFILPPDPPIHGVEHIPLRSVPDHIPRPPYARTLPGQVPPHANQDPLAADPYEGDGRIVLGSEDEKRLRRAAGLAKGVLQKVGPLIKPGTTTEEIDAFVHGCIIRNGAYPSPLRYGGFPKACCTSVNNVIAHGIPDDRPLEDGDIVNVDITVYLDGFHGDTSRTFLVGEVDSAGVDLVLATTNALTAGILACGPRRPFSDIGRAIHAVATKHDCSVNAQLSGHGIGRVFHRPPWILHHRNDEPGNMLPGHVFTIEPSLVHGPDSRGWMFPDGWTVATESFARSAQAEHTVLVTESGVEVLT